MSKTAVAKRGPQPVVRNRILVALKDNGASTVKALDTNPVQIHLMVKAGLIEPSTKKGVVQSVKGEGRGRPAYLYRLTIAGRSIATKVAKQQAAVAA